MSKDHVYVSLSEMGDKKLLNLFITYLHFFPLCLKVRKHAKGLNPILMKYVRKKGGTAQKLYLCLLPLNSWEFVDTAVVIYNEHQSVRLNRALVSLCQTSSVSGQKLHYRAVGLAKRRNNSSCVLDPWEHPSSWEIRGPSVAPLNAT